MLYADTSRQDGIALIFSLGYTLWGMSSLDIQEAESLIYWGYRA